jgi:hypothetical protein
MSSGLRLCLTSSIIDFTIINKKAFQKELHALEKKPPAARKKALEAFAAVLEKETQKLGRARAVLAKADADTDTDDDSVHVIDVVPASIPKEKEKPEPTPFVLQTQDILKDDTDSIKLEKECNNELKRALQRIKLKEYKRKLEALGHQNTDDDMSVESGLTEAADWIID